MSRQIGSGFQDPTVAELEHRISRLEAGLADLEVIVDEMRNQTLDDRRSVTAAPDFSRPGRRRTAKARAERNNRHAHHPSP
ncbi:MAG: hypothetical protein GEV10_14390 [Streptosporangiales bacterium]|nr:hypothetical protein [Streptosporangiales bacterium]